VVVWLSSPTASTRKRCHCPSLQRREANNVGSLQLKWSYTTGAGTQPVQSSPAVANGVVYVGSDDYKVYALNASTGALPGSLTTGTSLKPRPPWRMG